jgi:hypothetical protein
MKDMLEGCKGQDGRTLNSHRSAGHGVAGPTFRGGEMTRWAGHTEASVGDSCILRLESCILRLFK